MHVLTTPFSDLLLCLLFAVLLVGALDVDPDDPTSLKNAASNAAYNMMTYYHGNESGQIPGKLEGTWWEGGALFMTLIQYWHWTGDDTYNDLVTTGMIWQGGENGDFFPANYSNYLGNDDQAFWALAALTAAEYKYPDVADGPSWLSLAQAVFNDQTARWDEATCDGGLRWQIYPYQPGFKIKNAISNGALFQIAARLARYTLNDTYAEWAEKIWDWSSTTPLLDQSRWHIADTTTVGSDCTDHGDYQWTYNYATYIVGAAYLYNYTKGDPKWKEGVDGLLNRTLRVFFPEEYGGDVMSEVACETVHTCDRNQICFKGFLSSWLALTAQMVPHTYRLIIPKLKASAVAAGKQCSGGDDGKHCGIQWFNSTWDGTDGLEQQMAATSVFANNLVAFQRQRGNSGVDDSAPVTSETGGNSTSNPNAGSEEKPIKGAHTMDITTADRTGAGIVTVVFAGAWLGMISWLVFGA